ncbi:LysR family transcriptional regulator, partial [Mesorhizobium sp.]|uniref:LysR family transcriptional regulator n=1 Tax=Mesorhizobium sp. TaxID=1871066 RepID=UPI000FE54686
MQIELLDTFLDLIETRNFNRSADRLGVTQSTVSSRIRTLEGLLGKQLFIRNKSGTEPTVAGLRFEEHARAVMPKLAIYVEIDYSNQMILDLTTGSLDLAVLYSPQHFPDMHYEQIAEESFVMVSTRGITLNEITPTDYIRAN